jgi:hypothetical protein
MVVTDRQDDRNALVEALIVQGVRPSSKLFRMIAAHSPLLKRADSTRAFALFVRHPSRVSDQVPSYFG